MRRLRWPPRRMLQEGNRPPPDSGVLEKVNDWRLRNASAREAPPLQPSAAGRRGLYIQDIHTLQVYVRKDHCNEAGEKPLCYVSAGSSGLIYTVYNKNDLLWARRLRFHLRELESK